ncbi:hypothetical protein MKX01_018067, partial [Papaver californicum]
MPSSPKFFYPSRQSSQYTRKTYFLIFCVLIGISGFLFGLFAILRTGDNNNHNQNVVVQNNRYKVMGFVGIQTGFRSAGRRSSLRKTWFPSNREGLLRKGVEEYDDFMLLDIQEHYSRLPYKTLVPTTFFKAAYALFDSDFFVKADDDIYLRL